MITPFSLLFFRGKGIVSYLIRWITKGEFSHVAITIDNLHLIEVDWRFPVKIRHFKTSSENYEIYELTFELTEKERQKLIEFIHRELSKHYDWKFLWGRLLYILFGIKPMHSDRKFTCDEFAVELFEQIGLKLVDSKEDLTPTNLSKSKWLKKVR